MLNTIRNNTIRFDTIKYNTTFVDVNLQQLMYLYFYNCKDTLIIWFTNKRD